MNAPTASKVRTDPELSQIVSETMSAISNPTDLIVSLVTVALTIAVSLWITSRIRQRFAQTFVRRTLIEYLATPVLVMALLGVLSLFGGIFDNPLLNFAFTLVFLFGVVCVLGAVIELLFRPTPLLRILLRLVALVLWLAMVLGLFGDRQPLIGEFFAAKIPIGGITLSTDGIFRGLVAGVVIMIVALWGDRAIDGLLRRNHHLRPNFVLALSRIFSVLIWVAALVLIFSISGINLTALAAFSGALGIGLGLGLQRLAASYISGLIVLFEQSVRVGDNIATGGITGRVTNMTMRYTMVRTRDGIEAIVPNDSLTSSTIVNQSWSDRNLRLVCSLLVKADTDLVTARALLLKVMSAQARVLQEPPPSTYITGVTDKGVLLEGHFWICDPENGQHNVSSDIYDATLAAFRGNGIRLAAE